jgi:hypothetical protein
VHSTKKALDRWIHSLEGITKTFLLRSRVICKKVAEIPPALSSTPISYFLQTFDNNAGFEELRKKVSAWYPRTMLISN